MQGNYLDAKTVFLTLTLMNHVRISITLMFPNAISFGGEGLISMRRITTFLGLPERQESPNLNRNNFVVKGKWFDSVFMLEIFTSFSLFLNLRNRY